MVDIILKTKLNRKKNALLGRVKASPLRLCRGARSFTQNYRWNARRAMLSHWAIRYLFLVTLLHSPATQIICQHKGKSELDVIEPYFYTAVNIWKCKRHQYDDQPMWKAIPVYSLNISSQFLTLNCQRSSDYCGEGGNNFVLFHTKIDLIRKIHRKNTNQLSHILYTLMNAILKCWMM
jgi:hypothetical protein